MGNQGSAQTPSWRKVPDLIPTRSSTGRSESIQVGPRAASQSGLGCHFLGDWGCWGLSLFGQRRSNQLPEQAQVTNFPTKGEAVVRSETCWKQFLAEYSQYPREISSQNLIPDHGACPTGLEAAQELRQREGSRRQQDKTGQPHRHGEGHDIRCCKRDPSALNSQNDSLTYNNIT